MSQKKQTVTGWALYSVALTDAWTDFILSRQAKLCTGGTVKFYQYTAGAFVKWLERQGVTDPEQVSARLVRAYLSELAGRGLKDTTLSGRARAIRVLLRFWHAENYIPQPIRFDIPKVDKKRLPSLDADSLARVLDACDVRERALVMLMADTGLRRAETIALNWVDVDIQSGLVRVKRGKGGKARSVVVGATTRWALLAYRRTLAAHDDTDPVFQTKDGGRFAGRGLLQVFERLSKKAGVYVRPHAMRRTFAILSLRAGMSPLHLQALGGWADLTMVKHYAQMVDDDLLQAHKQSSPIDHLGRLRIK